MFYDLDAEEVKASDSQEEKQWSYTWSDLIGGIKRSSEQIVGVIKE
jgi:hypothetical protein